MSVLSSASPLALVSETEAPPLRLLPVPVCEPPFDDELPTGALRPAAGRPLGPLRSLAPLRLVPDPPSDDQVAASARTALEDLPAARPVARALVQGLLEVLAGVRPVSQLRAATSLELHDRLCAHVHAAPRSTGARPAAGALRSLHVQQRPEGIAEVCATVQRDGRTVALALRLEGVRGRWSCTDIAGL